MCSYLDQWPTFFTDFFTLIQSPSNSGSSGYNPHVSLLLFHLVLEISGEVADQLLKAARQYSNQRHYRDSKVRDAVRERDAAGINDAVLTIVADSVEQLVNLRKRGGGGNIARLVEVVDWGVRTFGSYVGEFIAYMRFAVYLMVNLWARLDRYKSHRHGYNNSTSLHSPFRSLVSDSTRNVRRSFTYSCERAERARRQNSTV